MVLAAPPAQIPAPRYRTGFVPRLMTLFSCSVPLDVSVRAHVAGLRDPYVWASDCGSYGSIEPTWHWWLHGGFRLSILLCVERLSASYAPALWTHAI